MYYFLNSLRIGMKVKPFTRIKNISRMWTYGPLHKRVV